MIAQLLRKIFKLPEPECPKCILYQEMLEAEKREKGEYYHRLMIALRVVDEPRARENKNLVPVGGITNWRARMKAAEKETQKKPGNTILKEWEDKEIVKAEEDAGIQGGS